MTLDEAIAKTMADPIMQIRKRPKDWVPLSCCVIAKHEGIELGFIVTRETYEDSTGHLRAMMDALCESVWQAAEMKRLGIPNPALDGKAA